VPEVIEPGRTGFIVDSIDEAVRAVTMARQLPREEVRAAFEERFTSDRMARDYVDLYKKLVSSVGVAGTSRIQSIAPA
jgi:glycosyltransferase involved in cell wall biosynthesis